MRSAKIPPGGSPPGQAKQIPRTVDPSRGGHQQGRENQGRPPRRFLWSRPQKKDRHQNRVGHQVGPPPGKSCGTCRHKNRRDEQRRQPCLRPPEPRQGAKHHQHHQRHHGKDHQGISRVAARLMRPLQNFLPAGAGINRKIIAHHDDLLPGFSRDGFGGMAQRVVHRQKTVIDDSTGNENDGGNDNYPDEQWDVALELVHVQHNHCCSYQPKESRQGEQNHGANYRKRGIVTSPARQSTIAMLVLSCECGRNH